jgi:hypothetical protein
VRPSSAHVPSFICSNISFTSASRSGFSRGRWKDLSTCSCLDAVSSRLMLFSSSMEGPHVAGKRLCYGEWQFKGLTGHSPHYRTSSEEREFWREKARLRTANGARRIGDASRRTLRTYPTRTGPQPRGSGFLCLWQLVLFCPCE